MRIGFVLIELELRSNWAIAAPESASVSDEIHLPVARCPFGEFHVPASSIAGALRAHLRSTLGDAVMQQWMGSVIGSDEDDGGDIGSNPSRLRIPGAEISDGDLRLVERAQTAIDPSRGVALSKSLRTSEALGSGVTISVHIRIDDVGDGVDTELLDAFTGWRPTVGRGSSIGMGQAEVTRIRYGLLDLDVRADLATFLGVGGAELWQAVATEVIEVDRNAGDESDLMLALRFRAEDGLFLGGGATKGNETFSRREDDGSQLLHGSSLKGVLRSRARFILRTIGETACAEQDGCGETGCRLCEVFGSVSAASMIRVHDAPLRGTSMRSRTHVAIDRVSGGAMPERLFVERDIPFRPEITIRVDWMLRPGQRPDWVPILLAWVMLDLHDGYIGLGGRTTRGLGTVQLDGGDVARLRELVRTDLAEAIAGATHGGGVR